MSTEERLKKLLAASPEQLGAIDNILEGKFPKVVVEAAGLLLLGMKAAAKFLGVSRTTLWRMVVDDRLKRVEVLPGSFHLLAQEFCRAAAMAMRQRASYSGLDRFCPSALAKWPGCPPL